jgi:hypothetical protein
MKYVRIAKKDTSRELMLVFLTELFNCVVGAGTRLVRLKARALVDVDVQKAVSHLSLKLTNFTKHSTDKSTERFGFSADFSSSTDY